MILLAYQTHSTTPLNRGVTFSILEDQMEGSSSCSLENLTCKEAC